MSGFSMYARTQMLSGMFAPDIFVQPTELEIALTVDVAAINSEVEDLNEPTSGGYLRQSYPVGSEYWDVSGFGELYNTDEIIFPEVLSSWGLITGWVVIDPDAIQVLDTGILINPFIATIGMVPAFDPGTITVGLYDT